MFNSFKKKLPAISIFHHPASPPSNKALNLLRASLASSYPFGKANALPLEFTLEVVESPPTEDQLYTIMSYLKGSSATPPSTVFVSAHPTSPAVSQRPETMAGIVELGRSNPSALRWPIVVDWEAGKASVGDAECILENLRRKRDGEVEEDAPYKPGWFV